MSCDLATVGSCPCFGISWYVYVCISGCTGFGGVRLVDHSQAGKSSWSSCLIELLQDRSIRPPGGLLQAIQIHPKIPSKSSNQPFWSFLRISSYSPPISAQPVVVCGASQRAWGSLQRQQLRRRKRSRRGLPPVKRGLCRPHLRSIPTDPRDLRGQPGLKPMRTTSRRQWTRSSTKQVGNGDELGGTMSGESCSQRAKIWASPRRVAHVKRVAFTVDMSKKHNIILKPSNLLGTAGLYYPLH